MKNFFQKQREIMALLVYVAVIAGIIYFAIFPLIDKIDATNYKIQEESAKQEIVKQHINELPRIQKQYETLLKSGDLSDVLLDKDKAVVLIEKLEKLAQQTNNAITIEAQNVDPKKVAAKSKTTAESTLVDELPSSDYLKLKIVLVGSYGSIINFIKSFENFEYYGDIIGIQINKNENKLSADSTRATSSIGVLDPFSVGAKSDATNIAKTGNEKLTAFVDTVFYVKQN